jgi:dTDP-glucose 4,6-dehydratase
MRRTVEWYLANPAWCEAVEARSYGRERLGLSKS